MNINVWWAICDTRTDLESIWEVNINLDWTNLTNIKWVQIEKVITTVSRNTGTNWGQEEVDERVAKIENWILEIDNWTLKLDLKNNTATIIISSWTLSDVDDEFVWWENDPDVILELNEWNFQTWDLKTVFSELDINLADYYLRLEKWELNEYLYEVKSKIDNILTKWKNILFLWSALSMFILWIIADDIVAKAFDDSWKLKNPTEEVSKWKLQKNVSKPKSKKSFEIKKWENLFKYIPNNDIISRLANENGKNINPKKVGVWTRIEYNENEVYVYFQNWNTYSASL